MNSASYMMIYNNEKNINFGTETECDFEKSVKMFIDSHKDLIFGEILLHKKEWTTTMLKV